MNSPFNLEAPSCLLLIHTHTHMAQVRFHLDAANSQLQQAYYGLVAAMATNRTFVLPAFHCLCATGSLPKPLAQSR